MVILLKGELDQSALEVTVTDTHTIDLLLWAVKIYR